jgi:energy-coupling factor transport system permease protein
MYNRQVWEATPADTPIHRLDVRTKLVLLTAVMLFAIGLDGSRPLFALFLASLGLHFLARSSMERWQVLTIFLLVGIWGTMVSQALFYNQEPRTMIASLVSPSTPWIGEWTGGIFIYREGLEYGAVQALRSGIMLCCGLLICWTTDPRQLLQCFLHWRMPFEIAFMLITSLRFLPVIFEETAIVLTAQRLRGFEPMRSLSPVRWIRTAFYVLFPILARSLRRAATLALSVESRGFGRGNRKSTLPAWPVGQRLTCAVIFAGILVGAVLKTLYSLQHNGVAYFPQLRGVYDFMAVWL